MRKRNNTLLEAFIAIIFILATIYIVSTIKCKEEPLPEPQEYHLIDSPIARPIDCNSIVISDLADF